jgi:ectoine hydroxylase-related dioxygenase (phytanoyl-CoA dioxygenase family)
MKIEKFSKDGYLIIKNALSANLIKEIQNQILKKMVKKKIIKNSYTNFSNFFKKTKNEKLFNLIKPLNNYLFSEEYINKILHQKKLFDYITSLLGRDLAVSADSSLTINLKDNNKNYYYKEWHQEIWSGASTSSVQIWLPLFHKSKIDGQISLMKNSHKWGHIPNSNKKPLKLPKNYSTIDSNLNIGDVILFSTTLLHKTSASKYPRLGLSMTIKNFKYKETSFSDNYNWKIFSYSEMTKIQRILGNHYLSPFRVIENENDIQIS